MNLTKAQKDDIASRCTQWSSSVLQCDGYRISLREERLKNRIYIMVYINGLFKGEYLNKECEIAKKFYYHKKSYLYKGKLKKILLRIPAKRRILDPQSHIIMVYPYWSSIESFLRNIEKTCQNIEIIAE